MLHLHRNNDSNTKTAKKNASSKTIIRELKPQPNYFIHNAYSLPNGNIITHEKYSEIVSGVLIVNNSIFKHEEYIPEKIRSFSKFTTETAEYLCEPQTNSHVVMAGYENTIKVLNLEEKNQNSFPIFHGSEKYGVDFIIYNHKYLISITSKNNKFYILELRNINTLKILDKMKYTHKAMSVVKQAKLKLMSCVLGFNGLQNFEHVNTNILKSCFIPKSDKFIIVSPEELQHWQILNNKIKKIKTIKYGDIQSLVVTPDSKTVITSSTFKTGSKLAFWSIDKLEDKPLYTYPVPDCRPANGMLVTPNGQFLILSRRDEELILYDISNVEKPVFLRSIEAKNNLGMSLMSDWRLISRQGFIIDFPEIRCAFDKIYNDALESSTPLYKVVNGIILDYLFFGSSGKESLVGSVEKKPVNFHVR